MGVETRLFFAKKEDVLADVPVGLQGANLPAEHLAIQCGNPVLVQYRTRNLERLRPCRNLRLEERLAVKRDKPEQASVDALHGERAAHERVEV